MGWLHVAGAGRGRGVVSIVAVDTVPVRLGFDCCHSDLATRLYDQLSGGAYDRCSAMPLPSSVAEWRAEHRTARKRASHARRLGYYGGVWPRHGFEDDIYEINTSAPRRQGRPMSAGYLQRPNYSGDPEYACSLHGVHYYGVRLPKDDVMGAGKLVAYLWIYRAGDLALVSSILGHDGHLQNDIMYPLFEACLLGEIRAGSGVVIYNRHDSGTDGLRYFKSKLGFAEAEIEWLP